MKHIYFFLTIDCDLRIGDNEIQKAGIKAMFELYNELDLWGRVSWFINENDFDFTKKKRDILIDICERNDSLGIHDHFDSNNAFNYKDAKDLATKSLNNLKNFYKSNGINKNIIAHRNGCIHQFSYIYKSLIELGYKVVSDVWPENKWYSTCIVISREENTWYVRDSKESGGIFTDNFDIPLNGSYWFHDENNVKDFRSKKGALIQLPIVGLGGPEIDRKSIIKAIKNSIWNEVFLAWDIHPYDLQDEISLKVEKSKIKIFKREIEWLINEYYPIFISIDDFYYNRILSKSKLFTIVNPSNRSNEN